VTLGDVDVVAPTSRDELLPETVEKPLEEALGKLDSVLDAEPPTLLEGEVGVPAEVVLGRPGEMLDPIDIEMLLVAKVELLRGGDVNGWLDDDTVDSGYGPIWLELDADAELTVGDADPLLILEAELEPTTLELLDTMEAVDELTIGDVAPLLEAELDPTTLELLDVK
jgi:hypothetical protein